MKARVSLAIALSALLLLGSSAAAQAPNDTAMCRLTIVYDNVSFDQTLSTDWGFSCLIEGFEQTMLFDTGARASLLQATLSQLHCNVASIDHVILSHNHSDHVGGLPLLIRPGRSLNVLCPTSFVPTSTGSVSAQWITYTGVSAPQPICDGIWTTGELGVAIIEQSLVLQTTAGLVVLTGCAHPGIINIVQHVNAMFPDEPIYLVIGGFHLLDLPEPRLRATAQQLIDLGVLHVAPTHCSGDLTRTVFAEVFGEVYVEAGLGWTIEIPL